MNFTLETAFEIAMTVVAALGGLWMRYLQSEIKELHNHVDQIRDKYQRRDDAAASNRQLMEMLTKIERNIERIDQKLDRKADK